MFKTYMFIQHTATIHCMYTYTDILYAEDTVISNTNYTQQSKQRAPGRLDRSQNQNRIIKKAFSQ